MKGFMAWRRNNPGMRQHMPGCCSLIAVGTKALITLRQEPVLTRRWTVTRDPSPHWCWPCFTRMFWDFVYLRDSRSCAEPFDRGVLGSTEKHEYGSAH